MCFSVIFEETYFNCIFEFNVHSPLRRPNGPRNATPLPITLSSMYLKILAVSSMRRDRMPIRPPAISSGPTAAGAGRCSGCGCTGDMRAGRSSLRLRLFVRLAFFRLMFFGWFLGGRAHLCVVQFYC